MLHKIPALIIILNNPNVNNLTGKKNFFKNGLIRKLIKARVDIQVKKISKEP